MRRRFLQVFTFVRFYFDETTMDIRQFSPISKADWLRQIAKDLKDKPLESLDWRPTEGVTLSPLVHAEDFPTSPAPIQNRPNAWEIDEEITVNDPVEANRQALEALEGGAEGLCFRMEKIPDADAFSQVMEGVHPDYIGLHFCGAGVAFNPGALLANLESLCKSKNLSGADLRGTLTYSPLQHLLPDWRYLADLHAHVNAHFPGYRLIHIADDENDPWDLSGLFRQVNILFEKLSNYGADLPEVAASMHFSLGIGKSYFVEIARLRAFKLLWFNVLKAWNLPLTEPFVAVNFKPETYVDDLYANMIRATTMAMSAVIGGAQRLTVLPYDAGREREARYPAAFGRRIARNVQHLLKMESGLDELADPAAGSFYVEKLTGMIAARSWEKLG